MGVYFRPLPAMTAACALLFVVAVGLGVWQLERLQWKLALIAEVERNMRGPAISIADAMALGDRAQYRRVAVDGRFDNAKEVYVFTTDAQGDAVYHVVTPLLTDQGQALLVDRGEVPKDRIAPGTRAAGLLNGIRHVVAVWRTPDAPGLFTPPPDRLGRIWYARDLAGIAQADHLVLAAPVILEADAMPVPGGWPRGGQTRVTFRNEHLSYAITWFGLAAVLVGVYLAFHMSRGRLGLKRRDAPPTS